MKLKCLLFCLICPCILSLYVPNKAEEIQHATCKIISEEIQATANATIVRELKGVCTSSELQETFNQFQNRFMKELDEVKYLLEQLYKQNKQIENDYEYNFKATNNQVDIIGIGDDILKYNDSITKEKEGDVYNYYWKIYNCKEKLDKLGVYIESPVFSILGHDLTLQLYPHYLSTDFVGFQLRPRSKGFLKKHIISLIDPVTAKNLNSTVLGDITNEIAMYQIPMEEVQSYINSDELLIMVNIFLNS